MDTKNQKPLKLMSMAPLDDGGRKYNIIYIIAVVIGVIIGICLRNGISSIVGMNLLTLPTALLIKHCILDLKWKGLRQQKFLLENRVPYDMLIQHLIERLSPLNFQVEKGVDGNPILTHKKMIYDVIYGADDSFTIWWRKSVVGAVFDFRSAIYHYRNTVADMGVIGYVVQELCCNNTGSNGQSNMMYGQNMNQNPYMGQPPMNPQDKKRHIGIIIIILGLLILVGLYWLGSSTDEELVEEETVSTKENSDNEEYLMEGEEENSYGLNETVLFELSNGGQISITFTDYGSKNGVAYINYVIENTGNTSVTVGESMFSVYSNDYIADLNYGTNTVYEENISSGRKVSGQLYPNIAMEQVKKLEIECGDVVFLLRDTSIVDAMLGTYYRRYEEDGNIIIDEIRLYREEYNNNGLAISANQHIDYGNEYDYDYDFSSWAFELYDDRIVFTSSLHSIGGLVVYYSKNPKDEGIFVTQVDTQSIEDKFTGNYEWTNNIQAVYEDEENVKTTNGSAADYLEAYSSIIEEVCLSYDEYCEYTLYDLDGDGVKELITSQGTCDADWTNTVYTIEKGYVSMIGEFYSPVMLYIAEDSNGLYAVSGHAGIQNIDQVIKNGSQLQVNTIMHGDIGEEEDYYSNDNPVNFAMVTDYSLLLQ